MPDALDICGNEFACQNCFSLIDVLKYLIYCFGNPKVQYLKTPDLVAYGGGSPKQRC